MAFDDLSVGRSKRPVASSPVLGPFVPTSALRAPAKPQYGPAFSKQTAPQYYKSAPSPAPAPYSSNVGTGGTGIVGPQQSAAISQPQNTAPVAPPAPPVMSQKDFLAQDAGFLDQQNQSRSSYEDLMTQLARQRSDFQQNNDLTTKRLGWNGTGWNQQDKLTDYGNAFNNQQGDFASRGLLDSSLYGGALNDLTRTFGQRKDDLTTQLQQFKSGLNEQTATAGKTRDQAIADAQRQAIQRYAATQGLSGI